MTCSSIVVIRLIAITICLSYWAHLGNSLLEEKREVILSSTVLGAEAGLTVNFSASSNWGDAYIAKQAVKGGYWCSEQRVQAPLYWWISFVERPIEIVSIAFDEKYPGAVFEFFASYTKECAENGTVLINGTQAEISNEKFEIGRRYHCYGLRITQLTDFGDYEQLASIRNFQLTISHENDCGELSCSDNGECFDGILKYFCNCKTGFRGKDCQEEIDYCVNVTCENGGTCQHGTNSFICQCHNGFVGERCEKRIYESTELNMTIKYNASSSWGAYSAADAVTGGYWCSARGAEPPQFWWISFEERPVEIVKIAFDEQYVGATYEFFASDTKECTREGRKLISGTREQINEEMFTNGKPYYCYGLNITNLPTPKSSVGPVASLKQFHFVFQDPFFQEEKKCKAREKAKCDLIRDHTEQHYKRKIQKLEDKVNNLEKNLTVLLSDESGDLTDWCGERKKAELCKHGATCRNIGKWPKYECECTVGYKGFYCDEASNECGPNPCLNGGVCEDKHFDFECTCKLGFTGKKCELETDECRANPCLNGGTCIDKRLDYECNCKEGFIGRKCEVNPDDCLNHQCQNGGKCKDGLNSYSCICAGGWTGDLCDARPKCPPSNSKIYEYFPEYKNYPCYRGYFYRCKPDQEGLMNGACQSTAWNDFDTMTKSRATMYTWRPGAIWGPYDWYKPEYNEYKKTATNHRCSDDDDCLSRLKTREKYNPGDVLPCKATGETYDEGWSGSKMFRYCAYGFHVKCAQVWGTKKFRCMAASQRNSRSYTYKWVVLDDGTSTKYVPCHYYSDCILDNDNFDRQSIKYPRLEENSPLWG